MAGTEVEEFTNFSIDFHLLGVPRVEEHAIARIIDEIFGAFGLCRSGPE
jgi:hypothetical protein